MNCIQCLWRREKERNKLQWASSICCCVRTPQCNNMQYNVLRACEASECDFVTHAEEVSMQTFSHKTFFVTRWIHNGMFFLSLFITILNGDGSTLGLDFDSISTTIQFELICSAFKCYRFWFFELNVLVQLRNYQFYNRKFSFVWWVEYFDKNSTLIKQR